ncbi:MAG: photosystem reaction center subunit H [Peptococcaceae bacterium]|jgi:uncharacterized protein YrrD|nr:photosystem reaction center subunit H [Peptococcaceae bacterium]
MLPSKKLISLPIISLKEGQKIGYAKNIVINPKTISVAALIVDPKRFFMEQRIIPFNRVVNIGENAITVGTESQAEKAANLPDIMHLLKEKTAVIGMKVITANGKTLGMVDEFYINREDGSIEFIDISGGKIEGLFHGKARLKADEIMTLGSEVMVVSEDSEDKLENCIKGINDNIKSFIRLASNKIIDQGEKINNSRKNKSKKVFSEQKTDENLQESSLSASINLDQEENQENSADAQQENKPEETKNEPA